MHPNRETEIVEERLSDGSVRISIQTYRRRAIAQAITIMLIALIAGIALLFMTPVGSRRWVWAVAVLCVGSMIGLATLLIACMQPASATHVFEVRKDQLVVRTFRAGDPVTEIHALHDIVAIRVQDDALTIDSKTRTSQYLYGEPKRRIRELSERLAATVESARGGGGSERSS